MGPSQIFISFLFNTDANQFKKAFEAAQRMLSEGPRDVEESSGEESEDVSSEESSDSENEETESKETGQTEEVTEKLGSLRVEETAKSED